MHLVAADNIDRRPLGAPCATYAIIYTVPTTFGSTRGRTCRWQRRLSGWDGPAITSPLRLAARVLHFGDLEEPVGLIGFGVLRAETGGLNRPASNRFEALSAIL